MMLRFGSGAVEEVVDVSEARYYVSVAARVHAEVGGLTVSTTVLHLAAAAC